MEFQHLQAFLLLSYTTPISLKKLPNEYCGDHDSSECSICKKQPWWEIKTDVGVIKVGWRKRVIELDWSKTGYKIDPDKITTENVTKGSSYIHCWGYGDLLNYWSSLKNLIYVERDVERAEAWEKEQKAKAAAQ
jgi:hypothetical protein